MKRTRLTWALSFGLLPVFLLAQYPGIGPSKVILRDAASERALTSVAGSFGAVAAPFAAMVYCDYPGLSAPVKTADRRPVLLVHMQERPDGRLYLVRAKPDKGSKVRSVKMGKMKVFSASQMGRPDSDWCIDTAVVQIDEGVWSITPEKDLKPGQYGLWVSGLMTLYDFEVDTP